MSKKYEDVSQETLDKEFENEDPDVFVDIKKDDVIEDDGFITVHPKIQKTEDNNDNTT